MDKEKKRLGRPPKILKNPVGRPKGDVTIMNEYKQRMLNSPKSRKVLEAIFDAALDNDHKNQAAAWKLLVDRMLPVSFFEQDIQKNNGKSAITINISGIGEIKNEEVSTVQDGEFIEISDETEDS